MRCEVALQGDHLNLKPSLEDIQIGLKNVIKTIIASTKNVEKWTEVGRTRSSVLSLLGVSTTCDVCKVKYTSIQLISLSRREIESELETIWTH